MNASEALHRILSRSCSTPSIHDGYRRYNIELCCRAVEVAGRPIPNKANTKQRMDGEFEWMEYDILELIWK